ncbi:MAG: hypothetical protein Q9225_002003 [Loekoesia sp. 1 TL-2023]
MVCSVGGGGLLCGVLLGLEKEGWRDRCKVLALETEGAESLNKALAKGRLVSLPGITSIATSLGATRVAQKALDLAQAQEHNVKSVVLSDAEAAMGCWRLADDERIIVEAACGVNVAVCYDGRLKSLLPELAPESKVVIVVCGGSNVTLETLMAYRKEYGWIEKKTTDDQEVPSTLSAPNGLNGNSDGMPSK